MPTYERTIVLEPIAREWGLSGRGDGDELSGLTALVSGGYAFSLQVDPGGDLAWAGTVVSQARQATFCFSSGVTLDVLYRTAPERPGVVQITSEFLTQSASGAPIAQVGYVGPVRQLGVGAETDLLQLATKHLLAGATTVSSPQTATAGVDSDGASQAAIDGVTAATPAPAAGANWQGFLSRLYDAAFHREIDAGGLQYWSGILSAGADEASVATGLLQSPEFQAWGAMDNQMFVRSMYQQVVHRPGDAGGIAFWTADLDRGSVSRAEVLIAFSESPEHQEWTRVHLTGMDGSGGNFAFTA